MFARLFAVMGGVQSVAVRDVRVMRGLLMVSSLMMLRGFPMMLRRMLMMFRGGSVMVSALV